MKITREDWLNKAMKVISEKVFARHQITVPDNVRVSCGLPSKRAFAKNSRVIGQCWKEEASADKHVEIFISPTISDNVNVLSTLTHEMIHAVDGCKSGHRGEFKKMWNKLGFEGKATCDTPGDILKLELGEVAKEIGDYPHAVLDSALSGIKKQSTRMIKLECSSCGYTVRTSRKWIDCGLPTCSCGTEFKPDDTIKE